MTRQVLYVAHPLAPTQAEIDDAGRFIPMDATPEGCAEILGRPLRSNIQRAMRWLEWLHKSFPETTFIAPWIAGILAGADDADPAQREAGLVDCCAVVERCDGIVLCGGRISSGMRREMEHGVAHSFVRFEKDPDAPAGQVFRVRPARFGVYDLTKQCYDPNDLTEGDQDWTDAGFAVWAEPFRVAR